MGGSWQFNESTNQPYWVEDPPPETRDQIDLANLRDPWNTPYTGYLPVVTKPALGVSPPPGQQYNEWPYGYGGPLSGGGPGTTTGGGGGTPAPSPTGDGGGGWGNGGGGPAPVDPYAWMADFGGPAIFKAFLRTPGERVTDYYKRHGGDPLKTILAKYQEIKGYAPTTELRSMMVGALGWGGVIDPNTLEPISQMPTSPLLENLAKTGGNYASYNKGTGLRYVGTRPWTEITRGFQDYSPVGAATWPPTPAVV